MFDGSDGSSLLDWNLFILLRKCPFAQTSFRANVLWRKRPLAQMSLAQTEFAQTTASPTPGVGNVGNVP